VSNRKKLKNEGRKGRFWRPGRESRIKAVRGTLGPQIDEIGLASVTVPEGEEVKVIKEVPAVVTHPETKEKVTVGTALIHDDRSVAIKFDDDAPQWAMDLIKLTEHEVGYSLETGGPING
jgi:hypothetical protein